MKICKTKGYNTNLKLSFAFFNDRTQNIHVKTSVSSFDIKYIDIARNSTTQ